MTRPLVLRAIAAAKKKNYFVVAKKIAWRGIESSPGVNDYESRLIFCDCRDQ